jgi:phage terminase large subunit GpA-like protein
MTDGVYLSAFKSGIRPAEVLEVWNHADRYRVLEQSSSPEPGLWRTSRTPYLREPMAMMSDHSDAKKVVLMFPTQVGKSEVLLNTLHYIMDWSPAPVMVVQPTIETAQRFSKRRISSMIGASKALKDKVVEKAKSGSNTILLKEFPGGFLIISGANSAASLASDPVKFLLCDEVDRWPQYLDGEGDPLSIAFKRTQAFSSSKVLIISTPTVAGQSVIEEQYHKGDQRKYHVPCPHCGWKQELLFDNLVWDKTPEGRHLPDTVQYACEDCGATFAESEKTWFLDEANGAEWIGTSAEADPYVYSYHLSALYAPLGFDKTWPSIVREYLEAQKVPAKMQVFANTMLAIPYAGGGDQLDWEKLYLRREGYDQGVVPRGGIILTAAVDVQQDRLEVEVKAWGRKQENWSIWYRSIVGDPALDATWRDVDDLLGREFEFEAGGRGRIRMMLVDAGYQAQHVYRFVNRHPSSKVMALRGRDNLQMAVATPKKIDYKRDGVVIFRGVTIQNVGVNVIKDEIFSWLGQPTPTEHEELPRGWSHFPEYSQEYFKGLCSEQLVYETVRGRLNYKYVKMYDRNEPLDLMVYNRAASIMVGVDHWEEKRWELEEQAITVAGAGRTSGAGERRVEPRRRHQSSWLNR